VRRFYLDRQTDVSGTSGTGAVVEGVQFSDGTCVVHWLTSLSSFSWYKNVDDVLAIHGHGGATNLHWIDGWSWVPPAPMRKVVVQTHGDPSDPADCGRPVSAEPSSAIERRADFTCPVHGQLTGGKLWQSLLDQAV
jgi:hypothetical protein